MRQRVPNLFIVGAPKCGTTSLYHFLNSHPDVDMSPMKEPHYLAFNDRKEYESIFGYKNFYTTLRKNPKPVVTEAAYFDLFKADGHFEIVGEASTSYLYSKLAPKRIYEKYNSGNLRILIFLRNPAERAYSQFLHHVRDGLEFTDDFFEAFWGEEERLHLGPFWHYRKMGFYAEQVKKYIDLFGRDKIKVIKFEDFKKNPNRVKTEICEFLGIEMSKIQPSDMQHNKTGVPKNKLIHRFFLTFSRIPYARDIKKRIPEAWLNIFKKVKSKNLSRPSLDADKKRKILKLYQEDIRQLEKITGDSFSEDWSA